MHKLYHPDITPHVDVVAHIATHFGVESVFLMDEMILAERREKVMHDATNLGVRITGVRLLEHGRMYDTFNRTPERKASVISTDPGVRIVMPWEDDFEEGFIPSNN